MLPVLRLTPPARGSPTYAFNGINHRSSCEFKFSYFLRTFVSFSSPRKLITNVGHARASLFPGNSTGDIFHVGPTSNDEALAKTRVLVSQSRLLAKQVISIRSALLIGFVSQIWIDTSNWFVLLIEVRPALLSGESDRFLLKDIRRVGDVILIEDERAMGKKVSPVALDTLIGYRVVTTNRRIMGKVRGYCFDVETGKVESLELDSFGISMIPSSLVTTYCLRVEDVAEVIADTVVVNEAAAFRIPRISKGLFGNKNVRSSIEEEDEEEPEIKLNFSRYSRTRPLDGDWNSPKDYL